MTAIGGFRSDLPITRKTDGNFGNDSAGVLFFKVAVLATSSNFRFFEQLWSKMQVKSTY